MNEHKAQLEEEKAKLVAELAALGRRDPASHEWQAVPEEADESDNDQNTQADRFEDFEEKSALILPLETRLAEVEAALAKIAGKGYGVCTVCGNPIEEERLSANPAASTCTKHMG